MADRYYFTDSDGKILGPSPLEQIRDFIDSGFLEITTDACEENSTEWRPLAKILVEHPVPAAAVTEPPFEKVKASLATRIAGATVKAFLVETKDRALQIRFGNDIPLLSSLDAVNEDFLTFTVAESKTVYHVPLTRLLRISENLSGGEVQLDFA